MPRDSIQWTELKIVMSPRNHRLVKRTEYFIGQSWVRTETVWLRKLEIPSIWPLTENACPHRKSRGQNQEHVYKSKQNSKLINDIRAIKIHLLIRIHLKSLKICPESETHRFREKQPGNKSSHLPAELIESRGSANEARCYIQTR